MQHTDNDTRKIVICKTLKGYIIEHDSNFASIYNTKQIELAQKLHQKIWAAVGLNWEIYHDLAYYYDKALKLLEASRKIAENPEGEKNVYIETYKVNTVTLPTNNYLLII